MEIPALKAASDEVEFFKCLLGAKCRGVSLLSARDEKRRKESLWKNCAWTWSKMNGVKGYVVRGIIGNYAAQSIFLPCAGYGHGTSLVNAGSRSHYWSSVPYSDFDLSRGLYFSSDNYYTYYRHNRYDGQSVRPLQGFTK